MTDTRQATVKQRIAAIESQLSHLSAQLRETEIERIAVVMLAALVQSQEFHEPVSVSREAFDLATAFVEERDRRKERTA